MGETLGVIGLLALTAALLCGMWYAVKKDNEQWESFKVAHHCKKVGEVAPTVHAGTAVNPANGQVSVVTTVEAGKEGWACDDGITYWR